MGEQLIFVYLLTTILTNILIGTLFIQNDFQRGPKNNNTENMSESYTWPKTNYN